MTSQPTRFVLGDIVRDAEDGLGVVAFTSPSGRQVLVQYGDEQYAVRPAAQLRLHLSAFASAAPPLERAIRKRGALVG